MASTEELITIFYYLMGSADEIDVIFLQELLDYCLTEGVGDATIVFTPAALTLLRIRPKQVAKKTIFGYLGWPSDLLELGNGDELG